MTIAVEPLPGAAVYFGEDGRLVFTRWRVTGPLYDKVDGWKPAQLAILNYLRERVEGAKPRSLTEEPVHETR